MKDLAHHIKKLNRRVIRSEHRETEIEEQDLLASPTMQMMNRPLKQLRRQEKSEMQKETLSHVPHIPSNEERNRQMQKRVPVFDRLSHPRPKISSKPKKKAPPF